MLKFGLDAKITSNGKGDKINYNECSQLLQLHLSERLSGYNQGLESACEAVKQGMLHDRSAAYATLINSLSSRVADVMFGIGRHEVVEPAAHAAASAFNRAAELDKKVYTQIIKAVDHMKSKIEEDTKQTSDTHAPSKPIKRNIINTEEKIEGNGFAKNTPSPSDRSHSMVHRRLTIAKLKVLKTLKQRRQN